MCTFVNTFTQGAWLALPTHTIKMVCQAWLLTMITTATANYQYNAGIIWYYVTAHSFISSSGIFQCHMWAPKLLPSWPCNFLLSRSSSAPTHAYQHDLWNTNKRNCPSDYLLFSTWSGTHCICKRFYTTEIFLLLCPLWCAQGSGWETWGKETIGETQT